MDRIFIQGLTTMAQIGVYDWEQQIQQKIVFDLELAWDSRQAAKTDDVQYCLNYAEVSEAVIHFAQSRPFLLIERLANEVANMLMQDFHIPWLRLKLHKPNAVPEAESVGILIERGHLVN